MIEGFDWTVELVRVHLELALEAGGGSRALALLRTLEILTEPARPLEGKRATISVEHAIWVRSITEDLLPERVADVRDHLRSTRGLRAEVRDPWAAIDFDVVTAVETRVRKRMLTAQQAAITACEAYERTGKDGWLREAVSELDGAVRFERTARIPPPSVAACAWEKERLHRALEHALPMTAFAFFVNRARERLEDAAPGTDGSRDHPLYDDTWSRGGWDRLDDVGRQFVPTVQAIFDAELAEKARERRHWQMLHEREMSTAEEAAVAVDVLVEPESPAAITEAPPPVNPNDGIDPRVAALLPKKLTMASSVEWVDSPTGPRLEGMTVDMAIEVRKEMDRQARLDAALAQQARDRADYQRRLRGW